MNPVDTLTFYGVKALTGYEDLPTIKHVEACAMKYLLECAKKDEQPDGILYTNVPVGKWKQYLKAFVVEEKNSEPYDLLFRPLITSPMMFFQSPL
jgi:hypothetical protein